MAIRDNTSNPRPFASLCVLVVDDDAPTRQMIAEVLRAAGVGRVETVPGGVEALTRLKLVRPDVILADWQMPLMDGLGMTRTIRSAALQPDPMIPDPKVPIVMLTARARGVDVENARLAGVTEFVIKPFKPEVRLSRLAAVTARSRHFVVAQDFVGPDRRRREADGPAPRRRAADSKKTAIPDDRLEMLRTIRIELEAIRQLRRLPGGGETEAARLCYRSMQHNIHRARAIRDTAIEQASKSLVRYVEAVGGPERADPKVVEVHIDALGKLLMLGDGSRAAVLVNQKLKSAVDKRIARQRASGVPS
jgi:CheY-like chemotaxis protein